tara:strand:+ start:6505 stop:7257 length:753 start_codon:yes stop_codon:yes gene_type:complete
MLTPLEQFQVISLLPITFFRLDVSLTNVLLISLLTLGMLVSLTYALSAEDSKYSFVPNNWQTLLETVNDTSASLVYDNTNKEGEKYFPFMSSIFTFVLFINLIGLIPYSFTVTSHLVVTFSLSLSIFIGLNIICVKKHGMHMLSLFIPANTSITLAWLLIPIEFVSYVFKPISLGVRLFANLMAGHTLLKVIIGFSWAMLLLEDYLSIAHVVPLLIIVLLFGLELGVAVIQAYVFTVLTCIYLNDSVNLH